MSVDERKAILRRFWDEVFNGRNLALIDEIFTPDWVYHGAGGQELRGPDSLKGFLSMFFAAFPDLQVTVEDVFGEGDRTVSRVMGRGTHQGPLMGLPPTGRSIATTVICINRWEGNRIAEDWELIDLFGMMQQLGVIPPLG